MRDATRPGGCALPEEGSSRRSRLSTEEFREVSASGCRWCDDRVPLGTSRRIPASGVAGPRTVSTGLSACGKLFLATGPTMTYWSTVRRVRKTFGPLVGGRPDDGGGGAFERESKDAVVGAPRGRIGEEALAPVAGQLAVPVSVVGGAPNADQRSASKPKPRGSKAGSWRAAQPSSKACRRVVRRRPRNAEREWRFEGRPTSSARPWNIARTHFADVSIRRASGLWNRLGGGAVPCSVNPMTVSGGGHGSGDRIHSRDVARLPGWSGVVRHPYARLQARGWPFRARMIAGYP